MTDDMMPLRGFSRLLGTAPEGREGARRHHPGGLRPGHLDILRSAVRKPRERDRPRQSWVRRAAGAGTERRGLE